MLPSFWLNCLLLVAAGMITTLAYAPYDIWWLPFISFALFSLLLNNTATSRQAAAYGLVFGLGWFGCGISWVHVSIDQFGGLPLVASLGLMALLIAYLALFPALAGWLTHRLKTPAISPLLLASCWTLSEWLRSWLFTGFPWLSPGYSQIEHGLHHYAPLIGETGISFLLLFSAAAVAQVFINVKPVWRYGYALVSGLILAGGQWLVPLQGWQYQQNSVSVLLVQGNIRQEMRWVPEQEWPAMQKYMDLTRPYFGTEIIIWPEAAIPRLEPLAEPFLENLNRAAFYQGSAVISGIIDYRHQTQQAWNNLIVAGRREHTDNEGNYFYSHQNRYSKHHLLPIGEFVPFESLLRKLAPIFDLPMSSFSRGSYVQPNLVANGYQLLPAICFEIAFPAQIAANFSEETDLLLTVSNDAWFGDSIGPHQHLQIARMRAKEFGRPVLRATNNGVTATIDADGSIRQQLPQFTADVLQDQIQLTSGLTPYSRFGNWPVFTISLLILLVASYRTIRKKR